MTGHVHIVSTHSGHGDNLTIDFVGSSRAAAVEYLTAEGFVYGPTIYGGPAWHLPPEDIAEPETIPTQWASIEEFAVDQQ